MYTVVLMAALSTTPATTGFGLHGCHGYNVATNAYCHGCACSGCSCYGGYGSYGGYGYGAYGYGSNFSIYAPPPCANVFGCTGCYGCYGGWSCYGVPLPNHGYWHECVPSDTNPNRVPNVEETPAPKELKGKQQTRARVIIDAPTDAKIYVDGNLVHDGKRAFYTPELEPEQKYFYDVRAEIVRDGRTFSDTQRLILGAGHSVTATFPNIGMEPAAAGE